MKKINKLFIVSLLLIGISIPSTSYALLPPYGGRLNFPIYCTCSQTFWLYFTPLYLSAVPMTGPIGYAEYAMMPYPYGAFVVPATSQLGEYVPAVQSCWMYVGVACVAIPALGTIARAGTAVPGN